MKPEHAQKWVDALRSGKYKQGEVGTLKSKKGYCCLGVLCEIFPEMDLSGNSTNVLRHFRNIELMGALGQLEYCKINLAMLNDGDPSLFDVQATEERFNFDEIADIIQIEYIEGL